MEAIITHNTQEFLGLVQDQAEALDRIADSLEVIAQLMKTQEDRETTRWKHGAR